MRKADGYYLTPPSVPRKAGDYQDKANCRAETLSKVLGTKERRILTAYFYPTLYKDDPVDAPDDIRNPLLVCASCPVRGECLLDALRYDSDSWRESGIRGGMTPPERRKFRNSLAVRGRVIERRGRYQMMVMNHKTVGG